MCFLSGNQVSKQIRIQIFLSRTRKFKQMVKNNESRVLIQQFLTININTDKMSNSRTEQLYGHRSGSTAQTTGITKIATLSPYLIEIQKRKKARSIMRQNRAKSKNENSSKSFRIKQRSTSSLKSESKRELNNKTIINIINSINARKKQQSNRSKYRTHDKDKSNYPSSTCTIKPIGDRTISKNDDGDITSKADKVSKKEMSFRKNKYESRSRNQFLMSNQQNLDKRTIEVTKYGYTDTNRNNKKQEVLIDNKLTENLYGIGKKKFRRGKYEALYSSVNSSDLPPQNKIEMPVKSESRLEISKKESNISINKQLDLVAQKEMQRFYRQMRSNQIRKSLQKSTQKYFKQDSAYRAPKTNNDIQIYVSTVKNPSLNRQSNASTLHTSQKQELQQPVSSRRSKQNQSFNYDFEFKQTEQIPNISGITQIENPSQEESINMKFPPETSFEKQRKQVERQYFNKKSPNIDWSEDDCQIDQV